MNLSHQFSLIHDFLLPYQRIWQNEIMLEYPAPLKYYPKEWIDELTKFTDPISLIKIEKKEVKGLFTDPTLLAFYQKIEALTQLPRRPELNPLPTTKKSLLHMTLKKQHEIKELAPLIQHLSEQQKTEEIIDIGGGVGFLAQTLNKAYDLKVTSVDFNPELQKAGIKKFENSKVKYLNTKVGPEDSVFPKLLKEKTMTVGLHTCGALAVYQIQTSSQYHTNTILNFGCCYEKLKLDPKSQNISQAAQKNPLVLNIFALTLAGRGHFKMSMKDYELKVKVKNYRYALHFLLYDYFGDREMRNLGNAEKGLYDQPFSVYAHKTLGKLGLEKKISTEELELFYSDPKVQTMIRQMYAGDLIRNAFGKVLEMYLLLDRALYLTEKNYKVELYEVFDQSISPRSIALVATL